MEEIVGDVDVDVGGFHDAQMGLAGCGNMSKRDQSTAIGAGAGAIGGAVLTGGSAVGTVGGAAVGGVIGNQVGK